MGEKLWDFAPKNVKVGDLVSGGDIVGVIKENGLFKNHYVMVHPHTSGRVKKIMPAGRYPIETSVLAKTIGMMKVIVGFHEAAQKTMAEFTGDQKIGWNTINNSMKDILKKITDMKFELPRQPEEHFKKTFVTLHDQVIAAFRNMAEEK